MGSFRRKTPKSQFEGLNKFETANRKSLPLLAYLCVQLVPPIRSCGTRGSKGIALDPGKGVPRQMFLHSANIERELIVASK